MFAFKILGLNNSVFPKVQELMLQISRELMKTCRGRLTTFIPLHWAGGWAAPRTAGMCWCCAKAMMNPVPSEAFSWRDRGGQAILGSILWSSQSSSMGCWSWHSCLPPKRERGHQGCFYLSQWKRTSMRMLYNIISFLQPIHDNIFI